MMSVIYTECQHKPFMLTFIMLNVITLSVALMNVMEPNKELGPKSQHFISFKTYEWVQ
jgi:hypothetical protein